MSGSDLRTVWARHGSETAEKISPNAKARIFFDVQPAGRTIIAEDDKSCVRREIIFSDARRASERLAGTLQHRQTKRPACAGLFPFGRTARINIWRPPGRPSRTGSSHRP